MTQPLPPGSAELQSAAQLERAPLLGTVAILLRHPVLITVVPFVFMMLAALNTISNRQWSATSKITPQAGSSLSGLLGVATQFGVSLPSAGSSQNESVDFYADLLRSREILDSLAATTFRFPVDGTTDTLVGTYMDLYEIPGPTEFDRRLRARKALEARVITSVKRSSSVVTVVTRARWGILSEQMNRRLLQLANQFNIERRQTQARSERSFLQTRLAELRAQQDSAQAAHRRFQETNRGFQDDPMLASRGQVLARRVAEIQQLAGTVQQSYETARAEEVRNTPVFTIVETPEGSRRRSGGLMLNSLLGFCIGCVVAGGLALALEYAAAERRRFPEAYQSVERLIPFLRRRRG